MSGTLPFSSLLPPAIDCSNHRFHPVVGVFPWSLEQVCFLFLLFLLCPVPLCLGTLASHMRQHQMHVLNAPGPLCPSSQVYFSDDSVCCTPSLRQAVAHEDVTSPRICRVHAKPRTMYAYGIIMCMQVSYPIQAPRHPRNAARTVPLVGRSRVNRISG